MIDKEEFPNSYLVSFAHNDGKNPTRTYGWGNVEISTRKLIESYDDVNAILEVIKDKNPDTAEISIINIIRLPI